MFASVPQHGPGMTGASQHWQNPGGKYQPREKSEAQAPDESRSRRSCTSREKLPERQSKQRSKPQTIQRGSTQSGTSRQSAQRSHRDSDEPIGPGGSPVRRQRLRYGHGVIFHRDQRSE